MLISFGVNMFKTIYVEAIQEPILENYKSSIVSSVALKIFSIITLSYYPLVGLGILAISFFIDTVLFSNIKKIKKNIKYETLSPEQKGKNDAKVIKKSIQQSTERVKGFFEELF